MIATIVGVYRRRNAEHVSRLLQPALEQGWVSGWWALDEVDPSLRALTVGQGPGLKLPLLNETLGRLGARSSWTVVSDDDVVFRKGDSRFEGKTAAAAVAADSSIMSTSSARIAFQ